MPVKFAIVSAPRTGSTLLAKTLNSIPEICCHGELLLPEQVRGFRDGFDPFTATPEQRKARAASLLQQRNTDALAFVQAALTRPDGAAGMKIIYNDLLQPRWDDVLQWLLGDPDVYWLHLQRRNPLRRYISERIMQSGGGIHSGMGGKAKRQVMVEVNIDAFQARSREIEEERLRVAAVLQGQPLLDVFYEDLSADTGSTIAQACKLLGIDTSPEAVTPALKKIGSDDLAQSVSNYAELIESELTRHWAQTP